MNQLQELEEQYKKLGAEIEKLKASAVEAEVWPKKGGAYIYVADDGDAGLDRFADDETDNYRLSTNNCHRTKEAAEAHRAYQMDPRVRARELVELCEGFDPLGSYVLWFISKEGERRISADGCREGGLRFTARLDAMNAFAKLGEDLIKVALGLITGEPAEAIVREAVGRV